MKKVLLTTLLSQMIFMAYAQNFDDFVKIEQKQIQYPYLRFTTYQGLFSGGHPYLHFRSYGGTDNNPLSTPSSTVLGSISFSGYNGSSNVQIGRIVVKSSDQFTPGDYPSKMNFHLGGTANCCGQIRMSIDGETGNVGIGIGDEDPDAKLTVKGDIHTQEVTVDLQGAVAPDFVFEEDYDLKSLEETEEYIQANKHLPEIPSASEMEEKGFELKEMNLKLLLKVEELTLYLIEQNKKIKNLEDEMAELKAKE